VYNPLVIRKIFLSVAATLVVGCAVEPLTPTPVEVTQPPPLVAIVTFTPAPSTGGSQIRPDSPPTATSAPAPTVIPSPTDFAPRPAVVNSLVVAPPTAIPPVLVAPPPSADVAAAEQYTIDLINAQRVAAGVAPLNRDETLMGIARARVADMVARGYTGHTDPVTGERLARSMMRAAGYTSNYLGENWYGTINAPPAIADIAMNWFMTDPPHAQNILNPHYVFVGVGIAYNGRQWLLAQNFAGN